MKQHRGEQEVQLFGARWVHAVATGLNKLQDDAVDETAEGHLGEARAVTDFFTQARAVVFFQSRAVV